MIRSIARAAAIVAVAVDLAGAFMRMRYGHGPVTLWRAAVVTGIALVPCALSFAGTVVWGLRRPVRGRRGALSSMRLPIVLPRPWLGAGVLGFIGTLAAMGERFGPFIFLAGIALIALALSQARPRRFGGR